MKSSESQPLLPLSTKLFPSASKKEAKSLPDANGRPQSNLVSIAGSDYIGFAFVSFSAVCFGTALTIFRYLQLKHNVQSTQLSFLMLLCLFLFSSIYLTIGIRNGHISSTIPKSTLTWLSIRGAGGALCMILLLFSLKYIPAGDSDTILFISPIITIFLSKPFLGETIFYVHILAAFFGLTGSVIVATSNSDIEIAQVGASSRVIGSLFAFAAAMANSIVMVAVRKVVTTAHFMFSVCFLGLFGIILTIPVGGAIVPAIIFNDAFLFALCIGAASCIIAGQMAYSYGFRFCPASTGSVIRNLEIPTAYILAVVILHDPVTSLRLFGSLLVVAGSAIIPFAKYLQPAPNPHSYN